MDAAIIGQRHRDMPRRCMRIGSTRKIAKRASARYHPTMKKSMPKLVIHRETLRVLADMELVLVPGGNPDAELFDTGGPGTGCVNAPLLDSEGAGTGCHNIKR